ncbi:MAG: NAD(P)H-dependent oxidoreductase [Candidatus Bathyarchaeota archaeon]|nr:NAD(P)H-dependent oxidoreductase [Candidatus Bathyarchaeota archaeon]
MDVLVLNGARINDRKVDEANETLLSALQKVGNISAYKLRDLKVADCVGCFGCWVKTPGICVIDDPAREIASKLAQTDLLIQVSPIVFGGYPYELKKVLDRQIPTILPFMEKYKGEIHHPQRYDKRHGMAAIGVLPHPDPESEAIFKTLVYRNSLNWQAPKQSTVIIYESDNQATVEGKISGLLTNLEVKI